MKTPVNEPIAITGMACRFPGAPTLDAFWSLLTEGRDAVTEVPAGRWDAAAVFDPDPKIQGRTNSRHGGFIDDIDRFDAAFFGITPREAAQMDPQQRILLELAYDAIEDAGLAPACLAGSDTSVFVGAMTNDYFRQQLGDGFRRIDVHTGSGAGLCMLANRLSYQFDLRGPSATLDTACSSSLIAVFQACQSLWSGQSRLALAAGVNVMLDPGINIFYAKAGLSAPDGRCKTFSAAANGIGRAEGGAVIVLKRLKDALADRDPIYAMIRGGAVNHDGRSNGLTQPNRWAQEALLRSAFRHARVAPHELQYVELHGTGTLIGDPIEANALSAVLTESGERGDCLVGSVKTNFGHLEAAAGIAGLIKTALGISRGAVPPSLWFDAPNPHIDFARMPLQVNTVLRTWGEVNGKRLAGVSSFGLGGANAHVVLQSAPPPRAPSRTRTKPVASSHCLLLSARSEPALRSLANAWLEFLAGRPDSELQPICAAALRRKAQHEYRLSIVGSNIASLIGGLRAHGAGQAHPGVAIGRVRASTTGLVLALPSLPLVDGTLLSGIGALPSAREAWSACRSVFGRHRITLPSAEALDPSTRITINHPAFRAWHFAAQYAWARQLLKGVQDVKAVFADGIGQLAALCALDLMSLAEIPDLLALDPAQVECRLDVAGYEIPCDFASGLNPARVRLEVDDSVWKQRLDASPFHDADVAVVSADRSAVRAGITLAADIGAEPGPRILAHLAVRHVMNGSAWADDAFVRLPSYPWQREPFWLAPVSSSASPPDPGVPVDCSAASFPLIGERADAPGAAWSSSLDPRRIAYLADHQVQGAVVLPGAAYVEIGLAVHAAVQGATPAVLEGLEFHSALLIDPSQPPTMHVALDEAHRSFTVHSRVAGRGSWEMHARGRLAATTNKPQALDLPALRARCTERIDATAHYQDMARRGFGYGPAFQGVREMWLEAGGERVLARIGRPEGLSSDDREHLHPALFDAALQSLLATLTARGDRDLYIPTGIDRLVFHGRPDAEFWCHGGLRPAAPGVIEGDIFLFDSSGRILVEASGVRAQALTRHERNPAHEQVLYRWDWEARPLPSTHAAGRWILVDDGVGASPLADAMRQAGVVDVVRIARHELLAPAGVQALLQSSGEVASGIAYVWPECPDAAPADGMQAAPLLQLFRALGAPDARGPSQLVIVTTGLQSVALASDEQGVPEPGQAPVLGLARVAMNEFPTLRTRLVDVDRTEGAVQTLAAELVSGDGEDEVALRGGARYVHRLHVAPAQVPEQRALAALDAQATHLITGGFGGFGLEVAGWLAARGVKHLVLAGRSGATTAQARQRIDALRAGGVNVLEARIDIAQEAEVAALLARIREELPPLKGVFHAAAALDDAPIIQLAPPQIDHAMAAKARGAWHLHALTRSDPIEHFVLFSSIASMLGGAGQASYAMACAYLDALARHRRALRLPALAINWGALAEVGMATRFGDVEKYLAGTGVGMFTPMQAVSQLEQNLASPDAELGIARMEWRQWAESYPTWARSPKYAGLLAGADERGASSVIVEARQALSGLSEAARLQAITDTLACLLAQTLELDEAQVDRGVPLPSLGLDSLMAMDMLVAIEDRFGVKVPMLALMKGNSLAQLARIVADSVGDGAQPQDTPVLGEAPTELPASLDLEDAERLISRLDTWADEDVERLLQQIMEEETR